jgi:hypothetical protein
LEYRWGLWVSLWFTPLYDRCAFVAFVAPF